MTKQEWQAHWASVDKTTHGREARATCPECQARAATQRKTRARKDRDEALRSLGLVKVKGALGGVYWE